MRWQQSLPMCGRSRWSLRPFPGGCVCARSDALGAQFFLHLGGHVVDDVADFGRRLAGLLDGQEAELQGRAGCRAQIRRERLDLPHCSINCGFVLA